MEEKETKDLEEAKGHEEEDFGSYDNKLKLALKTKAGSDFSFELFFNWNEIFLIIVLIGIVSLSVSHWWEQEKTIEQQVEEKFEMDPNPIIIEPKEN